MAATFTVEIERGGEGQALIIDGVLLGNRKLMMMFSKTSISSCLELKHNVNIEIFNTLNTPTSKTFCTIYYFPFGQHWTVLPTQSDWAIFSSRSARILFP